MRDCLERRIETTDVDEDVCRDNDVETTGIAIAKELDEVTADEPSIDSARPRLVEHAR